MELPASVRIFLGSKDLFSKIESEEILTSILSEMEMNSNFYEIIKELYLVEYAKKKKISNLLKRIEEETLYSTQELEEVMYKYGLIQKDEIVLIKNSKNLTHAIRRILELREDGRNFNTWIWGFIQVPFLILLGVVAIQIPLATYFMDYFENEIYPKLSKAPGKFIVEPEFVFYLENIMWTKVFLLIYVLVCLSIVIIYLLLEKYNIRVLYRIFNMKFYDDFYYYFSIMDTMKKARQELSSGAIFKEVYPSIPSNSLYDLFKEMARKDEDFYQDFERIGAPELIVRKIKSGEQYNTLWTKMSHFDNVDGTKKGFLPYLKSKRDNRMKFISKWYGKAVTYVAYGLAIAFVATTIGSIVKAFLGIM